MKYYSEVLEKFYDDSNQLVADEKSYLDKIAQEELMKQKEAARVATHKKELAKRIEDADAALDKAYKDLQAAKATCKVILDESNAKVQETLNPAIKALKEAEQCRVDAIQEFNEHYGVFKTSYTGDRAQKEFERTYSMFSDIFKSLFV